jgi:hypothetical protein
MTICKTPPHIRHVPMIRTRRPHHIRILPLTVLIPGPHDRGTVAIAKRKRLQPFAVRIDLIVVRIAMLAREWRVSSFEDLLIARLQWCCEAEREEQGNDAQQEWG